MNDLLVLWRLLQEAGDVATLAVLVVLWVIWRNDLRHIGTDLRELKQSHLAHLEWHAEEGRRGAPPGQ